MNKRDKASFTGDSLPIKRDIVETDEYSVGEEEHITPEQPAIIPETTPAKNWPLTIDRVFSQENLRIDASYFDPLVDEHMDSLDGFRTERLSELATLRLPGRFERVWSVDEHHGKPYLN